MKKARLEPVTRTYCDICGREPFGLINFVRKEGEYYACIREGVYHACRGECEEVMKERLKNKDKNKNRGE